MLEFLTMFSVGGLILVEGIRDLCKRKISMISILLFGILGILIQLPYVRENWLGIVGGIFIGVIIYVLSKLTKGKIGEGDGWILMITGIFLGFRNNIMLLLLSLWVAAAVSIFLLLLKKAKRKTELPFVFFMIPGYVLLLIIML